MNELLLGDDQQIEKKKNRSEVRRKKKMKQLDVEVSTPANYFKSCN